MSDPNTEPFNPCSACGHREACKIGAVNCRFDNAQKELSKVDKDDDSFKRGYVKAVNDYVEDTDEWITVDAGDYYVEGDTGVILFDYNLYREFQYKVTYSYGGETATDLEKKLHLLLVLGYMIKHKPSALVAADISGTTKSEKIGDYSITYSVADAKSQTTLVEDDIKNTIALLGGKQLGEDGYCDSALI